MSVPDYDQAWATAQERPAFSNGTEGECWMERNCYRCVNDDPNKGCELLLVALMGRTPAEWTPDRPSSISEQYRCMYFRNKEDGGGDPEPKPIPDPPGQLTLAPREQYEATRMLTAYPQPADATVGAL